MLDRTTKKKDSIRVYKKDLRALLVENAHLTKQVEELQARMTEMLEEMRALKTESIVHVDDMFPQHVSYDRDAW